MLSRVIAFFSALFLAMPAAGETLALTNVTVIDGSGAAPRQGMTILIRDGMIEAVHPGEPSAEAAGALDLRGHYVVPGLIDAHVHLYLWKDREALLESMLMSGITSVREMGGDARLSRSLARRARQGELKAPDIYFSATLFGPSFLQDRRVHAVASKPAPRTRAVDAAGDAAQRSRGNHR